MNETNLNTVQLRWRSLLPPLPPETDSFNITHTVTYLYFATALVLWVSYVFLWQTYRVRRHERDVGVQMLLDDSKECEELQVMFLKAAKNGNHHHSGSNHRRRKNSKEPSEDPPPTCCPASSSSSSSSWQPEYDYTQRHHIPPTSSLPHRTAISSPPPRIPAFLLKKNIRIQDL
eukprot:PhM_4_TR10544/c0_g5_i1/m.6059